MSSKVLSKSVSCFYLVDVFWPFLPFARMATFSSCDSEASQTSEMVAGLVAERDERVEVEASGASFRFSFAFE